MAGSRWAIVLAAGDERRRLRTETRGLAAPRQLCSSRSPKSMLRRQLEWARCLTGAGRIRAVVAAPHRRWWEPDLACFPEARPIVIPGSRGTASDALRGLTEIARRDAGAIAMILAADHSQADDERLVSGLAHAVGAVQLKPERMVLLGLSPTAEDGEQRWIVPASSRRDAATGTASVGSLVLAAGALSRERLARRGALRYSGLLVARLSTLLAGFEATVPELLGAVLAQERARKLGRAPIELPVRDLARDVLARTTEHGSVLEVGCSLYVPPTAETTPLPGGPCAERPAHFSRRP